MSRILVVDDDPVILETAAMALEKTGYSVARATTVDEAREVLDTVRIDLILSDIYMPGDDGLALLSEVRRRRKPLPVILMTARGTVETATIASRVGAYDYIAKPFDLDRLIDLVRSALDPVEQTDTAPVEPAPPSLMIGSHPSMVEVYKSIARIAPLQVPILILGETGTGKELVARAIHELGQRADQPFVAVNCGAIPDTLLESELFGYVRGAFTDARRDRRGALDQADGGTIFLDEIGDIALASQVKLLRFLQDRVVLPLGAERGHPVDVRVIAATNRDLPQLVEAAAFRQDLYFRLSGYEITLPPLRERSSDIPLLVEHFRSVLAADLGIETVPAVSREVMDTLESFSWPGNIRQLEQVIRRMLIDSGEVRDADLASRLLSQFSTGSEPVGDTPSKHRHDGNVSRLSSLEDAERKHILAVLDATGGNRTAAAEILGIERKTLGRKLKRYNDASSAERAGSKS